MEPAYERLGAFYLGGLLDADGEADPARPLLYDSRDLTTHAVCVGMTGSGKTGLCVSLLEEAAIDGVPAICIDPKGDLGNLLLTFPELRPEDFRPWIEPEAAARKGLTPDELAASRAELWRKGLARWNQDPGRIERLRAAADIALYTPGSSAGLPLSVLRTFDAPPAALLDDADALRDRIQASVSGLLALVGVDADPVRSREHILLQNILHRAWSAGRGLDLGALIREIQEPPFERVGVLDLESFFPAKDRFELAMALNNLLASPGFQAWMEGPALDVASLLHTAEGKPRISILSIAHLSDAERMFFVTILLNEIVAWMRTQSGTSSLRALLYMDEVFGYLPPTANPPSKLPLLTMLKQARAFGLGVVLATQNPVDLDYKALSNAGTWFLGRLQTERDKARVLDGLEGASTQAGAGFDRAATEAVLSGLSSRVFLMNNVHEDAPVLFHTRWALSFLRGPLTRDQIRSLTANLAQSAALPEPSRTASAPPPSGVPAEQERPVVPPGVPETFLAATQGEGSLVYRPALIATARVHYSRVRPPVDHLVDTTVLTPLADAQPHAPWDEADAIEPPTLVDDPLAEARFEPLPASAAKPGSYTKWERALKTHLYQNRTVTVRVCKRPKLSSKPDETEREFQARLRLAAHEARDLQLEKLRAKYTPKLRRMEERIRKAEERVERERAQYSQQRTSTVISFGTTLLGALFGRKTASVGNVGRAASTARSASRAAKQRGDIGRAEENVDELEKQQKELEADFEEALATVRDEFDADALDVTTVEIRPKKTGMTVGRVALCWVPWRITEDGAAVPAFS